MALRRIDNRKEWFVKIFVFDRGFEFLADEYVTLTWRRGGRTRFDNTMVEIPVSGDKNFRG
jgi:hypothetical protein